MQLDLQPAPLHQRLQNKYRPATLDEVIVSPHTKIGAVRSFLAQPYPAGWLFTGESGLGKTSLARIMANTLATHPVHIQSLVGNDVDVHRARDLEHQMSTPPLFGGYHVCIIDEADAITEGASVRLLSALDKLANGVFILTSNTQIDHFDRRLRSRLLQVQFSAHALAPQAMKWLQEIAQKEGVNLPENEADDIVRQSKTNLRECLKMLEIRMLHASSVPSLASAISPAGFCNQL